jgi:hypothetical protein
MERYDFYSDGFDNCEMRKTETGEYILYDDHKKEIDIVVESPISEIEKLRAENKRMREALEDIAEFSGTLTEDDAYAMVYMAQTALDGKE